VDPLLSSIYPYGGPGDVAGILFFLAILSAGVARNSLVALHEESFNRASRTMSLYSFVVGIAGFALFAWLLYLFINLITRAE
jgi:hypothetical protein